ncbi:hypothetical protein [Candidatus Uabimicrobium sp. HlEnr_7]|uniref:hypothetical protein n=1 Tax=Candidatus Uabimicrobium helgolandensis TaxID=3095367 RepID=UPI003558F516
MFGSLKITDVYTATEILQDPEKDYRVVSIMSPNHAVRFPNIKEVLYLEFHDFTVEELQLNLVSSPVLATKEHCKQALDFLDKGGDALIHCAVGKRRSTAIALGHLLKHFSVDKAVDMLFSIRSIAEPNTHILQLVCEVLGKTEDEYLGILSTLVHRKLNR